MTYYNEKHLQEWGHPRALPKLHDLVSFIEAGPLASPKPAKAMLIVSRDLKYAEPGKHPYIGSVEDHERVLEAAEFASAVIMGYNTVLANGGRGIKCKHLYIATKNPLKIDYGLPVFKRCKPILVAPCANLIRTSRHWQRVQNNLPRNVLVLGGPALIQAYIDAELLTDIELTVAPYFWPRGIKWAPQTKFGIWGEERYNAFHEMIVNLRMLANDKN